MEEEFGDGVIGQLFDHVRPLSLLDIHCLAPLLDTHCCPCTLTVIFDLFNHLPWGPVLLLTGTLRHNHSASLTRHCICVDQGCLLQWGMGARGSEGWRYDHCSRRLVSLFIYIWINTILIQSLVIPVIWLFEEFPFARRVRRWAGFTTAWFLASLKTEPDVTSEVERKEYTDEFLAAGDEANATTGEDKAGGKVSIQAEKSIDSSRVDSNITESEFLDRGGTKSGFKQLDQNGNGSLDRDEKSIDLSRVDSNIIESEFLDRGGTKSHFKQLDQNGDGSLDHDELELPFQRDVFKLIEELQIDVAALNVAELSVIVFGTFAPILWLLHGVFFGFQLATQLWLHRKEGIRRKVAQGIMVTQPITPMVTLFQVSSSGSIVFFMFDSQFHIAAIIFYICFCIFNGVYLRYFMKLNLDLAYEKRIEDASMIENIQDGFFDLAAYKRFLNWTADQGEAAIGRVQDIGGAVQALGGAVTGIGSASLELLRTASAEMLEEAATPDPDPLSRSTVLPEESHDTLSRSTVLPEESQTAEAAPAENPGS